MRQQRRVERVKGRRCFAYILHTGTLDVHRRVASYIVFKVRSHLMRCGVLLCTENDATCCTVPHRNAFGVNTPLDSMYSISPAHASTHRIWCELTFTLRCGAGSGVNATLDLD